MEIVLWVAQVLAGLTFLLAGFIKTTRPIPTLAKNMSWVNSFSPPFVRFIGAVEFLGGLGLIVPAATGILAWLTPLAAAGLAIVMLGAVVYHLNHHEYSKITPSGVLLVLAVIVLVGRGFILPL
jgi:uncharacterized membrane protein YphA (DoxX/SURF4 family)